MPTRALILIEGHSRGNGLRYVQAARSLGLHPITLSTDPTRYDYLATERSEAIQVHTDDLDMLIGECSRLRSSYDIAGITGFSGDDESVYGTVAKLCRHFDLPGPNPASVERCYDKCVQRQLLAEAGVPVPAFRIATSATDVETAAAAVGLPVVLKPAFGIGSIGVRLCSNIDELADHKTYLFRGGHIGRSSPRILVEEFAQGPYYCANMMGDQVIGIVAADFSPPPHFVYRETTFPAVLTDDEHKRITDVSRSCLRALDLGWGPTNIELRWTKRGPVVIEVNPRLAGAPDPQLVQLAYGVDLITEHIKVTIGEEWNLHRRHSHTAASRNLVPDRDGTLDWTGGETEAAAVPGVAEVKLYVRSRTPIVRKGDFRDLIGRVVVTSPSHARTEAILQRAVDLIDWSITPFPALNE
ncbi:MAG: ATP-grasp domain-containing protein [Mesorhizobium sp.]|uniref:ATP-grasp domain-containing protein n=1 Tax=Mesorhizobium sp. TaxID=1871066 RepID=UPI000FE48E98|nr:acetyl-CoA carboxylase biotin carboxylase subunit family protein [Mesorhizobium sp.]RWD28363.1 MAG: ATP-grasp domain-containing protein [Mesorhizobium sp.]